MQNKVGDHAHLIEDNDDEGSIGDFVNNPSTRLYLFAVVSKQVVRINDVPKVNENWTGHWHNWHCRSIEDTDCKNRHYLSVKVSVAEWPGFGTSPRGRVVEHFPLLKCKLDNEIREHHVWYLQSVEHHWEYSLLNKQNDEELTGLWNEQLTK